MSRRPGPRPGWLRCLGLGLAPGLLGCAGPGAPGPTEVPAPAPPIASTAPTPIQATPDEPPLVPHPGSGLPRTRMEVAGVPVVFEVADDPGSRGRGLSGRRGVPPGTGMLFVYPEPRRLGFWMNDCLTDLDIIYLDDRGRIRSMHRMVAEPPRRGDESRADYESRLPRYPSVHLVQFAMEFGPGTIDRYRLRLGDEVVFDRQAMIDRAR
ncbi:MAG: DUF192 domain-containing protein [Planctomycetota bacterium]|nr:DUF192 domain-containing protein [Planctomycetota bacterium]